MRRAVTSLWARRNSPPVVTGALWLSLIGAFGFLVWVDRHQWFDSDEWGFLVGRSVLGHQGTAGLLQASNGHWVTIPILGFRVLFAIFGARTYLPYIVVTIVVSLATTYLLWRLLLRIGVSPWLSVIACALFAVLGVAFEDLTSAFQWTLIGPVLIGLAALLISPVRGPLGRRDAVVVALLVAGLLFSNVGVVMVVVVTVAVTLRRGLRTGVAVAVVPAVVYSAWYFAYARHTSGAGQLPLRTALQGAPNFVWQGLLAAMNGATGLAGIGSVLLVLLAIWLLRNSRWNQEPWPILLATASGALVFLFLTALARGGLGNPGAQSSRYTYVVIALLLPGAALAVDRLLKPGEIRVVAIGVGAVLLLIVQLSTLNNAATMTSRVVQEKKHRVMAAAVLAREHVPVISQAVVPDSDPQLTLAAIDRLSRAGQLPGNVQVTPEDILTAREYLQTGLGPKPEVRHPARAVVLSVSGAQLSAGPGPGCITVAPQSDQPTIQLGLRGSAALPIRSGYDGMLTLVLRGLDAAGRSRQFTLPAGQTLTLSLERVPATLGMTLPSAGPTTICGVAPAGS